MSEEIQVRFARVEDEPWIIDFLRENWCRDHIFVKSPDVMRWQHQSPDCPDIELTFVLAQRKTGGELLALLGYIPLRRFDRHSSWTELALAIWKIRDNTNVPGLGLQLLKLIQGRLQPDMICAIGITPAVRPIYKALGFTVDTLSHVALFSEKEISSAAVASGVPLIARKPLHNDPAISLLLVSGETLPGSISPDLFDTLGEMALPRKSWAYVLERYIHHPWYNYDVAVVFSDKQPALVLVWRMVSTPRGNILRIVDAFGHVEVLARCGTRLREVLKKSKCDYIDLVFLGDYMNSLNKGGFISIADYTDMVLPAYFSPYEHRNITIECAFKCSAKIEGLPIRLHRADSDQDRPNRLIDLNISQTNSSSSIKTMDS